MSSTVLLKPFLEEWDGPLPRGFLALAVAKGITLQQQPFSLAPHTLQAMRRDLRHTSLAKALQVRSTIQSSIHYFAIIVINTIIVSIVVSVSTIMILIINIVIITTITAMIIIIIINVGIGDQFTFPAF